MKCITELETERTIFSLNLDKYENIFRQPKLLQKNKLVIMDLITLVILNPLKDCLAANYKIEGIPLQFQAAASYDDV